MHSENEAGITPEFLRTQLKVMAELELSEQTAENYGLFVGLLSTLNMLQPEGYSQSVPAFTFRV